MPVTQNKEPGRGVRSTMKLSRSAPLLALVALAGACTEVAGILAPIPDGSNHPGFDTSIYPGDAAMRAWLAPRSPYEWVGYYLPASCHHDTSWSGRRAFLGSLGWGTAVLYVGQQTWEGVAVGPRLAPAMQRAAQSVTCSRTLLTGAQGTIEGLDAVAQAANEGFAPGTVIYLDIEYMSTVTSAMREYYRSWVAQVLADGRYVPGIYCHKSNAATIFSDVRSEFLAHARLDSPRFWIASQSGFSLDRPPTDVGHDFANVWQGRLDTTESWNGVSLNIDVNVADRASPSAR